MRQATGRRPKAFRTRHWVLPLVVLAALSALPAASAQQPTADLYLHREGGLDGRPPNATADADAMFSLLPPHEVAFVTPPLTAAWAPAGPAELEITVQAIEVSVLGQLRATLDANGAVIGRSTTEQLLPDLQEQHFVLRFPALAGNVPAGSRVRLTIALDPLLDVDLSPVAPVLNLSLVDLKVDLLYDSGQHPSALRLFAAAAPPGVPGPAGAPGAPGSPGAGGGSGASGTGAGGAPVGGGEVELLRAPAGADPVLVMASAGTAATVLVAGLALRGRY